VRRVAVAAVGHVEWVEFIRVEHVPVAGEIVHAGEAWEEAAGGGAVAAVQLARLAGEALFFTALGRDEHGRRSLERLERLGVRVRAAWRDAPTRRAPTFIDAAGERTITTLGERLEPIGADELPWQELEGIDAVYFTAGDEAALRAARAARTLVASPRAGSALEGSVPLDALVLSANDARERRAAEQTQRPPSLVVATEGGHGGTYRGREGAHGAWAAAELPGPRADSYGCGDSFAAGLTYALAAGEPVPEALALAARCGATCLTGRGPYERQLTREDLSRAPRART
jgi:ribokinase